MSAKTMPLAEVLAKVTPGKWTLELARWMPNTPLAGWAIRAPGKTPWITATNLAQKDNFASIIADEHAALLPEGICASEAEANAIYLWHAANTLPGLVEALDGLKRRVESFLPPVDCNRELSAARAALAAAKTVQLPQ